MNDKPIFVSRDIKTADEGYVQWMADKPNICATSTSPLVYPPTSLNITLFYHTLSVLKKSCIFAS